MFCWVKAEYCRTLQGFTLKSFLGASQHSPSKELSAVRASMAAEKDRLMRDMKAGLASSFWGGLAV